MHPRPLFVLESTHRAALGLLALGVCALAGCALPDPVLPPEPEKVTTLRPDAGIDAGEPGDGGACVPVACTGLCGSLDDGCGHTVECGGCPTGELCGGGGAPNRCGAGPCTPSSCGQGACGQVPDGCGNTLECGGCLAPTTCGGGERLLAAAAPPRRTPPSASGWANPVATPRAPTTAASRGRRAAAAPALLARVAEAPARPTSVASAPPRLALPWGRTAALSATAAAAS